MCYLDFLSPMFILGIQRVLGIASDIRRQGFFAGVLGPGGLSGIAPIAVAGFATAGLFRNEIAHIIEELASEFI